VTTYSTPMDDFNTDTPDALLGRLLHTDHDRPPLGSFVFGPAYDGTCFIIINNLLHYCRPKEPEHWPALFFIEVGPPQLPGVTGVFYNAQPYYFTANEIYYIAGTGNDTFFPTPTRSRTGAQSVLGAVSVDSKGIFHTGPDGIYLFANGNDRKISEQNLEPIFRGETVQELPGVSSMSTSWLAAFQNNLYFGYQSAGENYPSNVLVMNLETNKLAYYLYNDGSNVEIRTITEDTENDRLLVGDNAGFVRVIESPADTDDSGTSIGWEIQSKDFTLQTRKNFPRWVKYDVDATDATSVTGKVILDDVVHHTHTITGKRLTDRRLVGTGNGNRVATRIAGSGPAIIYAAELE